MWPEASARPGATFRSDFLRPCRTANHENSAFIFWRRNFFQSTVRPFSEPRIYQERTQRIQNWSPTKLPQRLVKTVGRLVKRARHWIFLAEGHEHRWGFGAMLDRILPLHVPIRNGWN